ncbi:MAG: GyrI-like domain-containing protein [Acidobacteriota bacterium]
MKKLMLFLIVLAIAAGFSLNGETGEKFPVTKKKVEGFHFVYYEFTGPYQKAFEQFGLFMAYLKQNKIETGPYSVGIYLDNPQMTAPDKLRSEIGFMVKNEVKPDGIYKYKKVDDFTAISTRYQSMKDIQGAWDALGKYLMKNSMIPAGPGYEFYKTDKDPSKISAECFFPVMETK